MCGWTKQKLHCWMSPLARRASQAAPTVASSQLRMAGEVLRNGEAAEIFGLVRQLQQPVYSLDFNAMVKGKKTEGEKQQVLKQELGKQITSILPVKPSP